MLTLNASQVVTSTMEFAKQCVWPNILRLELSQKPQDKASNRTNIHLIIASVLSPLWKKRATSLITSMLDPNLLSIDPSLDLPVGQNELPHLKRSLSLKSGTTDTQSNVLRC